MWRKARLTVNPLNAELNPIRHLLALIGARHIVHVRRVRVKELHIHEALTAVGDGVFVRFVVHMERLAIYRTLVRN
jgi:hypothetical protein